MNLISSKKSQQSHAIFLVEVNMVAYTLKQEENYRTWLFKLLNNRETHPNDCVTATQKNVIKNQKMLITYIRDIIQKYSTCALAEAKRWMPLKPVNKSNACKKDDTG